jgi:hypothetical protein
MRSRSVDCGILEARAAISYAKFRSRSHDAVIRVYDAAGNVIETHEHAGESERSSGLSRDNFLHRTP